MPAEFTATAPGKLVVAGEYAVLDGALAISAAVNKRATATVRASHTGELLIVNTGTRYPFELCADGQPAWGNDPGESGTVLTAVLKALAANKQLRADQQPWNVELCSRDFYAHLPDGSTPKLGIGSSAAISVALTAALQRCMGKDPELAVCLAAHRGLQQGTGSGIDIATSWHGGVVLMQPTADAEPTIEQLGWPAGLHMRPVWTGIAASTPAMLMQLVAFRQKSGQSYANLMGQFRAALESIRQHWLSGDLAPLQAGLSHYGELLTELDNAASIGIWSDRHRQFQVLAKSLGIGYKPSGAGGGDFGLAFSPDAESLEQFVREVHVRWVPQTHGVDWAADGLRINGQAIASRFKS
jgi:phosphomevalonate kinase